jgi:6-pyruvoyltetrahydropterin/6-carboxytetrahydropterin synthase
MMTKKLRSISLLVALLLGHALLAAQADESSYRLGIRDSFMIAHSFRHPAFGPACQLHGATYTCDVEFCRPDLESPMNWVIDIGLASQILSKVLQKYNFQNLDELFPEDVMTTTEFMAKQIHADICERLQQMNPDFTGDLCVKLHESHKAWASYTGTIRSRKPLLEVSE